MSLIKNINQDNHSIKLRKIKEWMDEYTNWTHFNYEILDDYSIKIGNLYLSGPDCYVFEIRGASEIPDYINIEYILGDVHISKCHLKTFNNKIKHIGYGTLKIRECDLGTLEGMPELHCVDFSIYRCDNLKSTKGIYPKLKSLHITQLEEIGFQFTEETVTISKDFNYEEIVKGNKPYTMHELGNFIRENWDVGGKIYARRRQLYLNE